MTRRDLTDGADVRLLVEQFYGKLVQDPVIGHFFAGLDLAHHLPRIRAFWEMALLGTPGYTTNVTEVHLALARRIPMGPEHFERWLMHWRASVDELFSGPKADEAKSRATSIAAVIRFKVELPK